MKVGPASPEGNPRFVHMRLYPVTVMIVADFTLTSLFSLNPWTLSFYKIDKNKPVLLYIGIVDKHIDIKPYIYIFIECSSS